MKNLILILTSLFFITNLAFAKEAKPESYVGQIEKHFSVKEWTEVYELTNATLGYQQKQTPEQANIYFAAHSRDQLMELIDDFNSHQHNTFLSYLTVLYFQETSLREGILSIGDEIFQKHQMDIESDEVRSGWNHALNGAIAGWAGLAFIEFIDAMFSGGNCKKSVDRLLSSEKSYLKPVQLSINKMKTLKKEFDEALIRTGDKVFPYDFYLRPITALDKTAIDRVKDQESFVKELKEQAKKGNNFVGSKDQVKEQIKEYNALINKLKDRLEKDEILSKEVVPEFNEFIKKLTSSEFSVEGISLDEFTKMEIILTEGIGNKLQQMAKKGQAFDDSQAQKLIPVVQKLKEKIKETEELANAQIKRFDRFVSNLREMTPRSTKQLNQQFKMFDSIVKTLKKNVVNQQKSSQKQVNDLNAVTAFLRATPNQKPKKAGKKGSEVTKLISSLEQNDDLTPERYGVEINLIASKLKSLRENGLNVTKKQRARFEKLIQQYEYKVAEANSLNNKKAIDFARTVAKLKTLKGLSDKNVQTLNKIAKKSLELSQKKPFSFEDVALQNSLNEYVEKAQKYAQVGLKGFITSFENQLEKGIVFTTSNINELQSFADALASRLKNENFLSFEQSSKIRELLEEFNSQKVNAQKRFEDFETFATKLDSEVKQKPNRPSELNKIIKTLSENAKKGKNITKEQVAQINKLLADKDRSKVKFSDKWERFIHRIELLRFPKSISYIPRLRTKKLVPPTDEASTSLGKDFTASAEHLRETQSGNSVFKKSMVMVSGGAALGYAMYEYDEAYVPRKIRPADHFHFVALYQIHSLSAGACHLREKMKSFDMDQTVSDKMTKQLENLLAEAMDIQKEFQFYSQYKNLPLLRSIGVDLSDKLIQKSGELAIIDSELFSAIADIHRGLPEQCKPSQNPKLSLNGIERDLTIFQKLYIQAMEKYGPLPQTE